MSANQAAPTPLIPIVTCLRSVYQVAYDRHSNPVRNSVNTSDIRTVERKILEKILLGHLQQLLLLRLYRAKISDFTSILSSVMILRVSECAGWLVKVGADGSIASGNQSSGQ